MKTLKKALSIILGVAMILSCVAGMQISASAEDANPSALALSLGETTVDGTTVTVPIEVTENPGFQSLAVTVSYDDAVLDLVLPGEEDAPIKNATFTTVEDAAVCGPDANPFKIMWAYALTTENVTATGTIATLTFNLVDATAEATDITLTVTEAWNVAGNEVAATTAEKETVDLVKECKHENAEWVITTHPTVNAHGTKDLVCPDCDDTIETAVIPRLLKFRAVNPRLESGIAMIYKVTANYFDNSESGGFTEPFVKFVIDGVETTLSEYTVDGTDYVFEFKGMKPQQMKEDIVATICAYYDGELCEGLATYNGTTVNGTYTTSLLGYSLRQLAKTTSNSTPESLKILLVDMLNYGTAMQIYTSYKTDDLINADLGDYSSFATVDVPEMSKQTNSSATVIDSPSCRFGSVALRLTDSVKFLLRIETASKAAITSTENITVVATTADGRSWTITPDTFELRDDGKHNVVFDGLAAKEFRTLVNFTICENGVPVSNTLASDVESYCYGQNATVTDQDLADLCVAVMKYGDSAARYLNS